jgi:predicted DCC family thiol-disulfide oxidoreductase YuxK
MDRDTCYFDGKCGLCTVAARILRRLDWLGRLEFVDQSSLDDAALPIDRAVAMQGMPLITPDNQVLIGFPAVRRALRRTPLGAPLGWLLSVPGFDRVGRRIYRQIAVNRYQISACTSSPSPSDADPDRPVTARTV